MGRRRLSGDAWRALLTWHQSHRPDFPWRRRDPWTILVAEVLLQRTRAANVADVIAQVLAQFPSPVTVSANPTEWARAVAPLGLTFRRRAFTDTAGAIVALHDGRVPEERSHLDALPYVGHYTTGAVRCFGFGYREVLVDANTLRVAARVFGEARPHGHRTMDAASLVCRLWPAGGGLADENYALLDLARMLCRPGVPLCGGCPLRPFCATGARAAVHD